MAKIDIGLIVTALNQAGPGLRSAEKDTERLGRAADRTSGRLRAIQVVLLGIATGAAVRFGRSIVESAASLQSLQVRLAAATGSFENADRTFQSLASRFEAAPFQLQTIAEGFAKVAASGVDLERTDRLVTSLVDGVAAFGGDDQILSRAFLGFSQVAGKTTLQMEELRQQIGEAFPLAVRVMAESAGKSVPEFLKAVQNGTVGANQAIDLFVEGVNKRFEGFAEGLGFTLQGSLARIGSLYQRGLAGILDRTDFDERLTATFRNVGDAVTEFLDSINQEQIDQFFNVLSKIEQVGGNLIPVLGDIAVAVGDVAKIVLDFLAAIPQEAFELGIIGYALFGKKGLLIGGAIGGAVGGVSDLFGEIGNAFSSGSLIGFDPSGNSAQINSLVATFASLGNTLGFTSTQGEEVILTLNNAGGALVGTKEQVGQVQAAMGKLNEQIKAANSLNKPFEDGVAGVGAAADQTANKIRRLNEKISDNIRTVEQGLRKELFSIVGDELGASLDGVNTRFENMQEKISDAADVASRLQKLGVDQTENLTILNNLLAQSNTLRDQALAKEQAIFGLQRDQAVLSERIAQSDITSKITELAREINTNPGFNLLQGTEGGRLSVEVEQRRIELGKQLLEIQNQINQKNEELLNVSDPQQRASIDATISKLGELQSASLQAMSQLSEAGLLQQELWRNIGDTISNNIGDAVEGLITGSKSLEDVGQQMFNTLTRLAIDYLVQLIQIELTQRALAATSGVGGGGGGPFGFLGGLFGGLFANGGAFTGGIKPFADGDIIRGPTMFGLAGEAGTEAIMPLERIGGKLGVRAVGGEGGGTTVININAIDTQTGTEFLLKNLDTIQGGMAQRQLLNRGMRTRA